MMTSQFNTLVADVTKPIECMQIEEFEEYETSMKTP